MHVIAPLRQVPARLRVTLAATIAAMNEIDDLRNIRQGRVGRLVDRVVEAGTAMQSSNVGRSRMVGPFGISFVPSTSKNSRTPLTSTRMAKSPREPASLRIGDRSGWSGRLIV